MLVSGAGTVALEKLEVPRSSPIISQGEEVDVAGCACERPPDACSRGGTDVVTVGWSYVQLQESLAEELGFLPYSGIKLVAEPSQIVVSLHADAADLKDVPVVACPP